MVKKSVVKKISQEVQEKFEHESSGHDWWHIYRVWQLAQNIGKKEKADMFVVELAALLHDIDDWKNNEGDSSVGAKVAASMLRKYQVAEEAIDQIVDIIMNISFKGVTDKQSKMVSIEGKVVQDADRLDAIGAIGIGRTFTYGGSKGNLMYDPGVQADPEKYGTSHGKGSSTTINHFYEKLLLISSLMHTKTAKKMAKGRHKFMEQFLSRFYKEWNGEA